MRLILDLRKTADGRLAGTLRTDGSDAARPFEGVIDLVGLLEVFLERPPGAPGAAGTSGTARENTGDSPG